jgi:signal transduction histidine kinase
MALIGEQIVLPYLWRRYLSFLRALVGAACLWYVAGSWAIERGTLAAMLAFLVIYSLISIFWRWPDRLDRSGIFSLVLDAATFLLCVSLAGQDGFWVSAMAALYLFLSLSSLHPWREVLLMTVLALAFVNVTQPPGFERLQPPILLLGMMGCVLALQKKSLLDRLSNSSRQAVHYRSESQRAREAERERIAADFHDGPLQSFISFQMRLEVVRKMLQRNVDAGLDELEQLRAICAKQVTEMRSFIRGMRPVEVDGLGLATALRQVVAAFQNDSRIPVTFHAGADASHDDLEPSIELLQVLREALHNVQKHSGASRVAVRLTRDGDLIQLEIEDDGCGFPFSGAFTLEELELLRTGPESIKRRVRSLNGDLSLDSRPGRGAALRLRVPA